LISFYGYTDGSGSYFIVVDSDKCDGCGRCVVQCVNGVLQVAPVFIDLEDKSVVVVRDDCCNKIGYLCAQCRPEENQAPCFLSCSVGAIKCVFDAC